ncbi:DUF2806 domain-containing protein [Bacteroides sp. CG01]|uniref:DUF2806 domain-containing protein n=1 Tax=Bacteroides sp. CG01 TaxID=3096000 RepID=UPI002AFF1D48|nr:DUF2806 domain-containing protein [Bacteroides sp. CG01]
MDELIKDLIQADIIGKVLSNQGGWINTFINSFSSNIQKALKFLMSKKIAQKEGECALIKAIYEQAIEEVKNNATQRDIFELNNLLCIAGITVKEIPTPNKTGINFDWMCQFSDKARFVSNQDMRLIWGKILAGEINNPGKYSINTLSILSRMSKEDAEEFSSLSSVLFNDNFIVISETTNKSLIDFENIKRSINLGLITPIEVTETYTIEDRNHISIGNKYITLMLKNKTSACSFNVNGYTLSSSGTELAQLVTNHPKIEELTFFKEYIEHKNNNIIVDIN